MLLSLMHQLNKNNHWINIATPWIPIFQHYPFNFYAFHLSTMATSTPAPSGYPYSREFFAAIYTNYTPPPTPPQKSIFHRRISTSPILYLLLPLNPPKPTSLLQCVPFLEAAILLATRTRDPTGHPHLAQIIFENFFFSLSVSYFARSL